VYLHIGTILFTQTLKTSPTGLRLKKRATGQSADKGDGNSRFPGRCLGALYALMSLKILHCTYVVAERQGIDAFFEKRHACVIACATCVTRASWRRRQIQHNLWLRLGRVRFWRRRGTGRQ
jgi:hypothetical protein